MQKQLKNVFLILLLVLLFASNAYAESLFQLHQKSLQLSEEAKSSYQHLQTLEQINQLGLQRISQAMERIESARSENGRRYHQMGYIDERAKHVKAYAVYLIKLIQDQQRYFAQAEKVRRLYLAYQQSEQIRGLQILLGMVLQLEKDLLSEKERPRTLNTNHLQGQVELLVLGNMLALSGASNSPFSAEVSEVQRSVYSGLADLKDELRYLRQQLDSLPVAGG